MRLVLGILGNCFRSRNEHHDHCWSIQIDSSGCVWHDCLKPGEAKQRVLLHHGCLFEMQSDWPQAVPCGGKSHGRSSWLHQRLKWFSSSRGHSFPFPIFSLWKGHGDSGEWWSFGWCEGWKGGRRLGKARQVREQIFLQKPIQEQDRKLTLNIIQLSSKSRSWKVEILSTPWW